MVKKTHHVHRPCISATGGVPHVTDHFIYLMLSNFFSIVKLYFGSKNKCNLNRFKKVFLKYVFDYLSVWILLLFTRYKHLFMNVERNTYQKLLKLTMKIEVQILLSVKYSVMLKRANQRGCLRVGSNSRLRGPDCDRQVIMWRASGGLTVINSLPHRATETFWTYWNDMAYFWRASARASYHTVETWVK